MVAAGAGAKAQVTGQFESLGSNMLTISARGGMFRGIGQSEPSSAALTDDDVDAIVSLSQTVSGIAPQYETSGQVAFGSNNTQTSVLGVTPRDGLTLRGDVEALFGRQAGGDLGCRWKRAERPGLRGHS